MNADLLQQMVEKIGLQEVAGRIGYSKSAVCHVLRGTYKGKTEKVLVAAEQAFSVEQISCPVLGDIPLHRCIEEQNRPFFATNPIRVSLARTCPTCARKKGAEDDK